MRLWDYLPLLEYKGGCVYYLPAETTITEHIFVLLTFYAYCQMDAKEPVKEPDALGYGGARAGKMAGVLQDHMEQSPPTAHTRLSHKQETPPSSW